MFSFAQERDGFKWAVCVGLSASQIDGDGYSGYNQPGIIVSLMTTYKLQKFYILGDMRITQKGSRSKLIFENGGYFFSIRLNYIQFVPQISYEFLNSWGITLGVPLGYLFHYSEKDIFGKTRILAPYKKFEIALMISATKKIFEKTHLEIGHEYSIFPISSEYFGGWKMWFYQGSYNNILFLRLIYHLK